MKRRTLLVGAVSAVAGCVGSRERSGSPNGSLDLQTPIRTSPREAGGNLIVGADDGLVGVAPDLSETLWTAELDGEIFGRPAVADDAAFVTTVENEGGPEERARLARVDTTAGDVVWQTDLASTKAYAPTAIGERVLMRTITDIRTISMDGDLLWTEDRVPDAARYGPHRGDGIRVGVDDERLYVTSPGEVTALDRESRSVQWRVQADNPLSPPVVSDGVAYFPAGFDGVRAIEAESGTERWRLSAETTDVEWLSEGGGAFGTPIVGQSGIFASIDGHVVSTSQSGELEWHTESLQGEVYSDPVLTSGALYYTSDATMFVAVDPDGGQTRTLSDEWDTQFSPATTDTAAYCAAESNLYRRDLDRN
jgi:outer membrane protein assembly factor BamB